MKNRRSRLAVVLSFMAAACFLVAGLLSRNLSHAPEGSPSGGLAYFGLCALFVFSGIISLAGRKKP